VWTIDFSFATIYALNISNGTKIFSYSLGSAEHFITPSAAGGLVFAAGGNVVYAFSI
jgi:outer membrane protein assembly factor BamB